MKLLLSFASSAAALLLAGCASNFAPSAVLTPAQGVALQGSARGGQQPLTGSHIYLFAAGNTGYGSASTSMLRPGALGVTTDASGNGYVTTSDIGSFSITADYLCTNASDQVYLLAVGGNPGLAAGTNNTSIEMISALGSCGALTPTTFIIINELSTVAAANTLQQFYADPTHIGTSATNAAGLATAFATTANLVDLSGSTGARAKTPAGNGTVPQATINTLANIISACINSDGNTSFNCPALFLYATPNGGAVTETLTAAVDIALFPTRNVAQIFALSPASPPFQPALTSAPADFTLGIKYTLGGSSNFPGYLAIDATGNVWITSNITQYYPNSIFKDSIVKLSPTGAVLSGSGFTGSGYISNPQGIAIDDSGRVWITSTGGAISRLNNDGTRSTGFNPSPVFLGYGTQGIALNKIGTAYISIQGQNGSGNTLASIDSGGNILSFGQDLGNVYDPNGVSIDTSNNVWVAGSGTDNLAKYGNSLLSGTNGFTGGGLHAPTGTAIDATGRLWAVNTYFSQGQFSLSVFANNGTPVSGDPGYGYSGTTAGVANIVAIDGANTAWTAICATSCGFGTAADSVLRVGSTGARLNGTNGYANPTLSTPQSVAIDASGNLWVGNSVIGGTVTELVGVAAPVKTPTQAALKANLLGQRP